LRLRGGHDADENERNRDQPRERVTGSDFPCSQRPP